MRFTFLLFCLFLFSAVSMAENHLDEKNILQKGNREMPKPFTDLSHCDFSGKKILNAHLGAVKLDGTKLDNA